MSFDPAELTVYVNGTYVDGTSASLPVWDHGLLYGDGIFEGMRVFDGALFRPRDHFQRLERSARAIGMDLPLGEDELMQVVQEVVRRSGLRNAHVRPVVTRGVGTPGMNPTNCATPSVVVSAYPLPSLLGTSPLRVLCSSVVRKAPRSVGAHVKSLNYLDSILARMQANAAGMGDAVMLDHGGSVAECTGANIFCIINGRLVTPTTRSALPGITRKTIMEAFPVEERELWPQELHAAEAMFLPGSWRSVRSTVGFCPAIRSWRRRSPPTAERPRTPGTAWRSTTTPTCTHSERATGNQLCAQVRRCVDITRVGEVGRLHKRAADQQRAGALIAAQVRHASEDRLVKDDGVPGCPVVGRPRAPGRREHDLDDGAGDERHVTEEHEDATLAGEGRDSRAQRGGLTLLPSGADEVRSHADLGQDRLGMCAQDDQWVPRRREVNDVLEQRLAVELGELLRSAEASARAGGEDQGSRHSRRSASAASDASEWPGSRSSAWGRAARMPCVNGS